MLSVWPQAEPYALVQQHPFPHETCSQNRFGLIFVPIFTQVWPDPMRWYNAEMPSASTFEGEPRSASFVRCLLHFLHYYGIKKQLPTRSGAHSASTFEGEPRVCSSVELVGEGQAHKQLTGTTEDACLLCIARRCFVLPCAAEAALEERQTVAIKQWQLGGLAMLE